MSELVLPVNPVPLGRPRVALDGRGGARARTPRTSVAFRDEFRWYARAGLRATRPTDVDLVVTVRFRRQCFGSSRGDIDNLVKAVLDAGNELIWVDDRQIVELHAHLDAWGPKVEPRIHLAWWPAVSPDPSTATGDPPPTLDPVETERAAS